MRVWECENVRVWECESVRVWECESVRKCENPKSHFSKNLHKRPRIFAFQITRPANLGTFVLTRRKVAKNKNATFRRVRANVPAEVRDLIWNKSWDVWPNSSKSDFLDFWWDIRNYFMDFGILALEFANSEGTVP